MADIGGFFGGFFISILGFILCLILFLFVYGFIAIFGLYHYDYRCTPSRVTEQRLYVGSVPFGGWDPVDNRPLNDCEAK